MEPITSNDFLNSVLENEAWKEVSQCGYLSMAMVEKFADNLDWEEVSGNSHVIWTVEGINKFANRIHWDEFSRSCPENLLSETTLQKFASKWDWKALSNRDDIYNNWHLLEKFADKVNWGEVITNWRIEKPLEFFARFQQYIPMSKLQDSRLWNAMVEARAKRLMQEAMGIVD
ncbi:hypothetical protein EEL49_10975 [Muribaculaceae bacterium Isolate-104 (HZI)]|jgi:hypothetical protein|nr:hypothetical protein EEL49_10975 [Muribaculaceae bacterium Isolate-104 (HZI)]